MSRMARRAMRSRIRLGVATSASALIALGAALGAQGSASGTGQLPTLRIAVLDEPPSLDAGVNGDARNEAFVWNVQETLLARDQQGRLVPVLATSWKQRGQTWNFYLRRGVRFHDGSTFDSSDVEASFNRVIDPNVNSVIRSATLAALVSVRAAGPYTVRMVTRVLDSAFPLRLLAVPIMPKEVAEGPLARIQTSPVGTGPYRFAGWDRGREIRLNRFASYWGKEKGAFSAVRILPRPDASVRLAALRAGEVDIALGLSFDQARQAPRAISSPVNQVATLRLNGFSGKAFADRRLRLAASMAIDKNALIKGLLSGFGSPAKGQIVSPGSVGYDPKQQDWPFDPQRARQYLQQAGKVGTTISFSIPNDRYAEGRLVGQALSQMLERVGFNVEETYDDTPRWIQKLQGPAVAPNDPNATPDVLYWQQTTRTYDAGFPLSFMVCGGAFAAGCDPSATTFVKAAEQTTKVSDRAQNFGKAANILRDNARFVPLYVVHQLHGISKRLEWKIRPTTVVYYSDIRPTSG